MSSPDDLPALEVKLDVSRGWLNMRLEEKDSLVEVTATGLTDCLSDLARSVLDISGNRLASSCLMPGEPRGFFVDFVKRSYDSCGVAVHATNTSDNGDLLIPFRGNLLFSASVPLRKVVIAFSTALASLQVRHSDAHGYMAEWGWRFPRAVLEDIERSAWRFGHRPEF